MGGDNNLGNTANQQQPPHTPTVSATMNPSAHDALFPLQLPQIEIRKPGDVDLNRTLTRTIIYPVGKPIVEFTSTKQLVEAIRDAIEGKYGYFFCGLLVVKRI